jgi:hypothetical protein
MYVRWHPLLSAHSHKQRTSDKSLKQSFDVLRVLSEGCLPGRFLSVADTVSQRFAHPQQYSIATRDTVVPMNIDMPTKCPLSHNTRTVVLEICLHSKSPMLYRPLLHGN